MTICFVLGALDLRYGYMAYRFARGFRSTTYQQDYRIPLAMFWPFLFAVNGSFRKNFLTAIKSED